MQKTNQTIKLYDGRIIGYHEFGDGNGKPLFYFHGSGAGSGYFARGLDTIASQNKIRIIAPDRPGIGLSDFQQDRTILDWSKDILQLAKSLNLTKFSIISESGGSVYALACAHEMPDRISSVSIVSGICPINAPFKKDDLTRQNRIMLSMFKRAPGWLLKSSFQKVQKGLQQNPEKYFLASVKRAKEAEKKIFVIEAYQKIFIKSVLAAFDQGFDGPLKDIRLTFSDWGFEIKDITSKIYLWHGMDDQSAPVTMAKYLEENIPNAAAKYLPDEGHISVLWNHGREIAKRIKEKG
jgi:pimeloyl-ACP methyl ester carboxylesterase